MLLSPPSTRNWPEPPPDTRSGETDAGRPAPPPPSELPCSPSPPRAWPFSELAPPPFPAPFSEPPAPMEVELEAPESDPPQAASRPASSATAASVATSLVPRQITVSDCIGSRSRQPVCRGDAGVQN